MAGVTLADIDRAYSAALKCPLEAQRTCALGLKEHLKGHPEAPPPDELLRALGDATRQLGSALDQAKPLVDPIRELLHLCSAAVVEMQGQLAPSHLEAYLAYLNEKIELAQAVLDGQTEPQNSYHNLHNVGNWARSRLEAELHRERARVRDRLRREAGMEFGEEVGLWRFDGGRVVLLHDLGKLRHKSRRLMEYFIGRKDRLVSTADLASDVWENEYTRPQTIQQAMSQLRKDLKTLGLTSVVERIRTEDRGYVFA